MPWKDQNRRRAYQRWSYCTHPRSLRLRAAASARYRIALRLAVFRRDDYTCISCGFRDDPPGLSLVMDHRRPASRGGPRTLGNFLTACATCNTERGDLPYERFLLLKQTGAPFSAPWVRGAAGSGVGVCGAGRAVGARAGADWGLCCLPRHD